MKNAINWLRNLRPLKVLSVFLIGSLLVLTQACNRPSVSEQPPQPAEQAPNVRKYDSTTDYPTAKYERGMNNLSDVDHRAKKDEKAAESRANELIKTARKNVENKGIDSTEQYVRNFREGTPLGDRVKNLGEDVGSSAGETAEGAAKGTKRGIENVQENAKNAAKDLTKNVQRGTEDISKNIQRQADETGKSISRNLKDVIN